MKKNQKIIADLNQGQLLFIHQGALGDQLLSLPILKELSNNFSIYYLGRGLGYSLITHFIPCKTISLDLAPSKLQTTLSKLNFKKCISVGDLDWLELNIEDQLVLKTQESITQPIWKRWSDQVFHKSISPFYAKREKCANKNMILAPGSGSTKKNWPIKNYIDLSKHLDSQISITVFMGPCEEEQNFIQTWEQEGGCGRILSSPNAEQLIELFSNSTHFIGNDSGPAHLASVFNLKGLVLFLSSDMHIWQPYGENLYSIEPKGKDDVLDKLLGLL